MSGYRLAGIFKRKGYQSKFVTFPLSQIPARPFSADWIREIIGNVTERPFCFERIVFACFHSRFLLLWLPIWHCVRACTVLASLGPVSVSGEHNVGQAIR